MIVLSPLWIPLAALQTTILWLITRFYVWRPIHAAWARCAAHWKSVGRVMLSAPHVPGSFAHTLAIALGTGHRRNAGFFLEQLHNPDPLLAGYAFKCLIRANPDLTIDDIPSDVLERTDEIPTLWADLGAGVSVGHFVKGYFRNDVPRDTAAQQ